MRDFIGKNVTTKQVKYGFKKVALEFEKILDPDLPVFYHTSTHARFSEGLLLDFNQQSMKKDRRLPRHELTQVFSVRRATLPVHGSLTLTAQFYNPIELPPPPTGPIEHSYS